MSDEFEANDSVFVCEGEKCPICGEPLEFTYDFNENGERIFGEICTFCCYEHYEE